MKIKIGFLNLDVPPEVAYDIKNIHNRQEIKNSREGISPEFKPYRKMMKSNFWHFYELSYSDFNRFIELLKIDRKEFLFKNPPSANSLAPSPFQSLLPLL